MSEPIHFSGETLHCKGGRNDVGRWDQVTCPDCLKFGPPTPPSIVLLLSPEEATVLCDVISVAREFEGVDVSDASTRLWKNKKRLATLRNKIDHAVIVAKTRR